MKGTVFAAGLPAKKLTSRSRSRLDIQQNGTIFVVAVVCVSIYFYI